MYFFDSSEDPDGYIVEWYWYYSLWFGGTPTLPMPFEEGEQNKPNPTLTFEFEGGYPSEVMIGLAVTDDDGATDSASRIIQILPSNQAEFSLATLYEVNLKVNLWLENNSKLVVKFYTWGDDFEGENVVRSGPAPDNVVLLEEIPHPLGKAVENVRLDLTTDNTENVISTIASFTVRKVDLEVRFTEIPLEWSLASPEERVELEIEYMKIPIQWALAPL